MRIQIECWRGRVALVRVHVTMCPGSLRPSLKKKGRVHHPSGLSLASCWLCMCEKGSSCNARALQASPTRKHARARCAPPLATSGARSPLPPTPAQHLPRTGYSHRAACFRRPSVADVRRRGAWLIVFVIQTRRAGRRHAKLLKTQMETPCARHEHNREKYRSSGAL